LERVGGEEVAEAEAQGLAEERLALVVRHLPRLPLPAARRPRQGYTAGAR
jgi:hypothetical protein